MFSLTNRYLIIANIWVLLCLLNACSNEPKLDLPALIAIEGGKPTELSAYLLNVDPAKVVWNWQVDEELAPDDTDKSSIGINPIKVRNCDRISYNAKVTASIGALQYEGETLIRVGQKVCNLPLHKFENAQKFTDIVSNDEGLVAISTTSKGLFVLKYQENNKVEHLIIENHNKENGKLLDNKVTALFSKGHDIWFSTSKSIGKIGGNIIDLSQVAPFDNKANNVTIGNFFIDDDSNIMIYGDSTLKKAHYLAKLNQTQDAILDNLKEVNTNATKVINKYKDSWILGRKNSKDFFVFVNQDNLLTRKIEIKNFDFDFIVNESEGIYVKNDWMIGKVISSTTASAENYFISKINDNSTEMIKNNILDQAKIFSLKEVNNQLFAISNIGLIKFSNIQNISKIETKVYEDYGKSTLTDLVFDQKNKNLWLLNNINFASTASGGNSEPVLQKVLWLELME
jgi:hypothetical protein